MILTSDASLAVVLAQARALELSSVVSMSVAGNSAIVVRGPHSQVLAPELMRRQFRSTAFYLGRVVTDASGEAVARAELPDNLTTFRLMAVAVDNADRFGSADTTLLVTRPLVARSTMPRFVRPADTLLAGAAVNARDATQRDVDVETSADGVAILGETKARIALPAGKGAEGRFNYAVPARNTVGDTVVVRIGASDGIHADATETKIPVKPDFNVRAHAAIGAVRGASEFVMKLPAGIDPARSRLSLRIGTS